MRTLRSEAITTRSRCLLLWWKRNESWDRTKPGERLLQWVNGDGARSFRRQADMSSWRLNTGIWGIAFSVDSFKCKPGWAGSARWLSTCSSMELILSTSQSMRKRFSCRRSISSMIRLYSVGFTMFPTERAVTCQLLATADSMMAWRMAKPGGAEGGELRHAVFCCCIERSRGLMLYTSLALNYD